MIRSEIKDRHGKEICAGDTLRFINKQEWYRITHRNASDAEIAARKATMANTETKNNWAADLEAATRYQQSIAGNPDYCAWPTYRISGPTPDPERGER